MALVRGSGVELHRSGANWLGLCPWHEDGAEHAKELLERGAGTG